MRLIDRYPIPQRIEILRDKVERAVDRLLAAQEEWAAGENTVAAYYLRETVQLARCQVWYTLAHLKKVCPPSVIEETPPSERMCSRCRGVFPFTRAYFAMYQGYYTPRCCRRCLAVRAKERYVRRRIHICEVRRLWVARQSAAKRAAWAQRKRESRARQKALREAERP